MASRDAVPVRHGTDACVDQRHRAAVLVATGPPVQRSRVEALFPAMTDVQFGEYTAVDRTEAAPDEPTLRGTEPGDPSGEEGGG